jgi:hypothetical protein
MHHDPLESWWFPVALWAMISAELALLVLIVTTS